MTSRSLVLLCLSKSFTPTTRFPVTPQLITDVLRVPRAEFPNYPSCECLRIVSKDELKFTFCEHPSELGEH